MSRWDEIADGVFRRRYEEYDIGITVIRGSAGLIVVDTRSSHRQGEEIRRDLAPLGGPEAVRWVVNTHAHYDHAFGNACFDGPIVGHERVPAQLADHERRTLEAWIAEGREPLEEWREIVLTPPTVLVGDRSTLDLGDREVELLHLGRGHTDNDLILRVSDARTWVVGDLIDATAPYYWTNCYPLEWPSTIARLLDEVAPGDVLAPGHGPVLDREAAQGQQAGLQRVADLLRELYAAGADQERAQRELAARWTSPPECAEMAVRDAFRELDRESGSGPRE